MRVLIVFLSHCLGYYDVRYGIICERYFYINTTDLLIDWLIYLLKPK